MATLPLKKVAYFPSFLVYALLKVFSKQACQVRIERTDSQVLVTCHFVHELAICVKKQLFRVKDFLFSACVAQNLLLRGIIGQVPENNWRCKNLDEVSLTPAGADVAILAMLTCIVLTHAFKKEVLSLSIFSQTNWMILTRNLLSFKQLV